MDSYIRDNGRKEKNKIGDFLLTLWEMSIKAPFWKAKKKEKVNNILITVIITKVNSREEN